MYKEERFNNFREIIRHSAAAFGDKTAFIVKNKQKQQVKISYLTFKTHFYRLASYLLHNGFGGKRIAVVGKNSYEWLLSYFAAATVGVAVPIDKELSEKDVGDFLDAAECAAVCSGKKLDSVIADRLLIPFETVFEIADGSEPIDTGAIDAIDIPKDKTQVLIFTSGTTGNAKGVCLSQYNICSDIFMTVSVVRISEDDVTLSILPMHHTYECSLDCILLLSRGSTITFADGLMQVASNIKEYRPTLLVVVPALMAFLAKRIKKSIAESCPMKYKSLYEELSLAEALSKTPFLIRSVIRHKVRATLGGRLRLLIVGAADLDVSLIDDFDALGIRTLQGYGLTECAPLLAGNTDFFYNKASTGIAIPGVTLKIDSPNEEGVGEILAKGDNIMLGYFNDPASTAAVFRDGWFCTGDLGKMGEDGALYIKGRIKNVIVTANGKNVYPEELETRLAEYPEISESLVLSAITDGAAAVKAKILPNIEYLKEKLGRLPTKEECIEAVSRAVKDVNEKIPHYKHITVIETLESALERTTTQKIRRSGKNLE